MTKTLLLCCLLFPYHSAFTQDIKLHGKITNSKLEPLAFVSIQLKETKQGTTTKEDGSYQLMLSDGKWDLVISMVGYQTQIITIALTNADYVQNIILQEDDKNSLSEVIVKGKRKDISEQIIRNVIQNKEKTLAKHGNYTADLYIKAVQQDSSTSAIKKRKPKQKIDSLPDQYKDIKGMAMTEISIRLDAGLNNRIKEERLGVTKRGNSDGLFYLTVTDGDFSLYNNLLKVPNVSVTPFLSPISYSGLLAYRFKMLNIEKKNNQTIYTISVKPRQMSNSTVEGELVVSDKGWVLLQTKFSLPRYHLPEYDEFKVTQQYNFINDTAWMLSRQEFNYYSKAGKRTKSGNTVVHYRNYQLNKTFPSNHFGVEISSTAQEAYEKDSSFWNTERSEPLTPKELKFIYFSDSVYRYTHTKAYLDSVDKKTNKLTWKKLLIGSPENYNREKERRWVFNSLFSLYQPFTFGGTRIMPSAFYSKTFKSKKNISAFANLSYGIRNKDFNGSVNINRMYNPFNRGFYRVSAGREFQFIFQGDAWINMLKRSNIYLNNIVGVGHGLELLNGLFLFNDLDISFRRSVANYKTNSQVDSVFGDVLDNNQAVAFEPYNALYHTIKLQYTPGQRYIREPKEKIILGSKWPTFYTSWRKGIPGVGKSKVNFDYLEFGIQQRLKIGLAGISSYKVISGSFITKRDLRLIDYKYQRRGDPFLFLNPNEAFQALDSTFPVFKRFYEGHYLHEFNGAIINKIPFLKKLNLREVAGAGFLIAGERNLRYVEAFAGVERVFKWPFNPLDKFKVGIYVVGSAANQFRNPVQFKIGITTWDKRNNKWN